MIYIEIETIPREFVSKTLLRTSLAISDSIFLQELLMEIFSHFLEAHLSKIL